MDTTITIEFFSDTKEHLKTLEQRLKHERDVDVDMLIPRDATAPALVSIGIKKHGERAEDAAQRVAQTLHSFLHDDSGQKQMLLLTIEGDRMDIQTLSVEQIKEIILEAKAEE
ncbi:MAG TPA: hypothetical protein VJO32_08575 [Ktedonobacteraceae bacterium]|nr:hypothetical protein [Ktedonobacteraceae bacterium]